MQANGGKPLRPVVFAAILLFVFTLETSTAAPTTKPADVRALLGIAGDQTADGPTRLNAIRDIARLGPVAKSAIPELCKWLKRTDSLPGASLDQEASRALKAIGPEGAKAAVAAARAELFAQPPGKTPYAGWADVLVDMAPAATLADWLGDNNLAIAETAAMALFGKVNRDSSERDIRLALPKLGPKLAIGWRRAASALPPPILARPAADKRGLQAPTPELPWETRRAQWIAHVNFVADASGPEAVKAVADAATAVAKSRRPNTAAATAAIKQLVRAVQDKKAGDSQSDAALGDAMKKVVDCGADALAPLAELIANNDAARVYAINSLGEVMGGASRGALADPDSARRRLMLGKPPAVLPLAPRDKAAFAKAIPALAKLAEDVAPDGQNHPQAAALSMLAAVAPDVSAAADWLVIHLDKVPEICAPLVASSLSACGPTVGKRVESAASSGGERAKDIAFRVRLLRLPPKEAAAEIVAKISLNERGTFVSRMQSQEGPRIIPLLIELLMDVPSSTQHTLQNRAPEAMPVLLAALERPEPAIRAGVVQSLPRNAMTPDVLKKIAPMLADDVAGVVVLERLRGAGTAAVPALLEQLKNPAATARARAADGLAVVSQLGLQEPATDAEKSKVAAAVFATLVSDAEPAVRAPALRTTARLPVQSRALIETHLKSASASQRQALAQALVDAAIPNGGMPLSDQIKETIAEREQSPQNTGPGYRPDDDRHPTATFIVSFAKHKDAAIASAVEDVLLRADVVNLSRTRQAEADPTAEQERLLVDLKSPDPAIRIKALVAMRQMSEQPFKGSCEATLAAMDDADPAVRVAAVNAFPLLITFVDQRTFVGISKLIRLDADDPAPAVRDTANYVLDQTARPKLGNAMFLARLMATSEVEADRATAASVLGELSDPRAHPSRPNPIRDRTIAALARLLTDPAAPVRRAAAISLAKRVSPDQPDDELRQTVMKMIVPAANAPPLEPGVKVALIRVVPWLAQAGERTLTQHPDPDIQAAAMLGLEQPRPVEVLATSSVPIVIAVAGLGNPSPWIRQMAVRSLLAKDPADPNRVANGTTALLTAANDPRPDVAANALEALVTGYCGERVGPGERTFKEYQNAGMTVVKFPSKYEVAVAHLMKRCATGLIPDRIAAIAEVGAGEPKLLAARWDAFSYLLEDPDPQIRAAAFGVARTQVQKAVPPQIGAGPRYQLLLRPLR